VSIISMVDAMKSRALADVALLARDVARDAAALLDLLLPLQREQPQRREVHAAPPAASSFSARHVLPLFVGPAYSTSSRAARARGK
jgi:hypothetical protein